MNGRERMLHYLSKGHHIEDFLIGLNIQFRDTVEGISFFFLIFPQKLIKSHLRTERFMCSVHSEAQPLILITVGG